MNKEISEKVMEKLEDLRKDFEGGYFNYRVIEKEYIWENNSNFTEEEIKEYKLDEPELYYEIHEVYYNGKDEIVAWTENPISIYFEDYYDVKDMIKHIKNSTKHKILKLIANEDGGEELIELNKYMKNIK